MSSVLSAQASASLVEMDRSSEHSDTPSKTFASDPSPSTSPASSHTSTKSPARTSPPRTPKAGSISPPPQPSSNAPVNGHAPDHEEEKRFVPSQSSPRAASEQNKKEASESGDQVGHGKEKEAEGDDSAVLPNSDPEEDADLGSGESDGDWSQDEIEADIRRVKVYELVGQKWTDRGTAFCQGDYDDDARSAKLMARAEHTNEILLECSIRTNDVYQRQQDTLIVWTEPDGTDYALSFQDIEGCAEVWEFISEVQRHLQEKVDEENGPSESGSSGHTLTTGTMNTFSVATKLPMPALGHMHECERAIKQNNRPPHGKEKLCDALMQMDYVKQIIDVMKQAEDLEDIKELHACCSCMQTILMLNDHNLYEYVLQDHIFFGMVGVLEYDPEFPTHKASYREFLENSSHFRQPIPIREPATRHKIHQTYRLQFLKDVVLARATDDATFNVLNSCIIFNQIDIVNQVQQDERFLRELVGLFLTADKGVSAKDKEAAKPDEKSQAKEDKPGPKGKQKPKDENAMDVDEGPRVNGSHPGDSSTTSLEIGPQPSSTRDSKVSSTAGTLPSGTYTIDDRRKDTILLIQQLCLMGKNVQLPARMHLFRTLVDRGILHAIQWALGRPERQMISTAGEVLSVLLDHDINGIRQHVMKQVGIAGKPSMGVSVGVAGPGGDVPGFEGKRETLLETLCRSLTTSHELAYKSQMADALRAVLEVPQSEGTDNIAALRAMGRAKDDPVTERFLDYFYGKCSEALFRPMAELPEHHKVTEPVLRLSRERSSLFLYLCDLLSSFTLQHSFRSHFFLVSNTSVAPAIVPRVASLLQAKEKHLRLAALRFFRVCLKLGNRNLFAHLIKHDVISPILDLTARESKWDNLLSSCCQEFFEHIRRENIKELLTHLMIKYESKIQELAQSPVCGQRFQNLIRRWEMNNEPPPKEADKTQTAGPGPRKWGQGRLPEDEEDDYFNNSDEDESSKNPWPPAPPLASLNTLKRKRAKGLAGISAGPLSKQHRQLNALRLASPAPLVDYDEDEDEGSSTGGASSSKAGDATPKPRVSLDSSPSRPVDWFSSSTTSVGPTPTKSTSDNLGRVLDDDSSGPDRLLRPGSPPRMSEKRRRSEEDDDDELLERLVKGKKQNLGLSTDKESKSSPKSTAPAKMKLKLGATSISMASTSPTTKAPPEKDTKDVDGG